MASPLSLAIGDEELRRSLNQARDCIAGAWEKLRRAKSDLTTLQYRRLKRALLHADNLYERAYEELTLVIKRTVALEQKEGGTSADQGKIKGRRHEIAQWISSSSTHCRSVYEDLDESADVLKFDMPKAEPVLSEPQSVDESTGSVIVARKPELLTSGPQETPSNGPEETPTNGPPDPEEKSAL